MKLRIFTDCYKQLLGTATPTDWGFDLAAIYEHAQQVIPEALVATFTDAEIKAALRGMYKNSAPGPDGFGAGF